MNEEMIRIKNKSSQEKLKLEKNSNILSTVRLTIFICFITFLYLYFSKHNNVFLIFSSFFVLSFIIVVLIHSKIDNRIKKMNYYLSLIKRYEDRSSDEWKNGIIPFVTSDNNIVNDLNIINNDSLLKYIDFTQSLGGKNNLIKSLSLNNTEITKDSIKTKQEAISEINTKYEFILDFQYTLSNIENIKEIDYKDYFYFFESAKDDKKLELGISIILSILTILSLFLSVIKTIKPHYFVGLFFLQIISSYIYMTIYNKEFNDISKCSRIFGELKYIYDFIDEQEFNSKLNSDLKSRIKRGKNILKEINNISDLNSYRLNFITYIILNVFCSLNFVILYKYNKLLQRSNQEFKDSIIALEEFEKLISLTTVGIVKKNICMPIIEDDYVLELDSIKHLLIVEEKCISNSFVSKKEINIITGSNMSGKTSFMKTIGINLILAYNGTYVNAKKFTCPIAKIFTSINVQDDITHGISTFYGELKRIKEVLDYSKNNNGKLIVFIDEIFKGTNYNDRIYGATEILKKLSELNAIVFLTTHDFELCDIKNKTIKNYHFEEKYTNEKISFDYKIKSGKCTSTNAKYIMTKMGIIDHEK